MEDTRGLCDEVKGFGEVEGFRFIPNISKGEVIAVRRSVMIRIFGQAARVTSIDGQQFEDEAAVKMRAWIRQAVSHGEDK